MNRTCDMCPRALRSDNKSGMCRDCSRSSTGQKRRYAAKEADTARRQGTTEIVIRRSMALGVALGHTWEKLLPDVAADSWLTRCTRCGGWLVIDPDASDEPYGSAYSFGSCPGFIARAAPRRDQFAIAHSSRSLADEPPDSEVDGLWQRTTREG